LGKASSAALTYHEIIELIGTTNKYVVNIGASDDAPSGLDPANALWVSDPAWGRHGLAIEGDKDLCRRLKTRLNPTNVTVFCGFATPPTILQLFKDTGVPAEPDFLKLDIDSADCPVLEKLLEQYRPRYIHMEVNFEIPPPIVFSVEFSEHIAKSWFWSSLQGLKGYYGCSLKRVELIGRRFGYSIIQAPYINADLVRNDLLSPFGDIPRDALSHFPGLARGCDVLPYWGRGKCAAWRSMSPEAVLLEMWASLTTLLPLETLRAVPFQLYIHRD
jgi:hypothetical protein